MNRNKDCLTKKDYELINAAKNAIRLNYDEEKMD